MEWVFEHNHVLISFVSTHLIVTFIPTQDYPIVNIVSEEVDIDPHNDLDIQKLFHLAKPTKYKCMTDTTHLIEVG
jgi:hypothetical protein